VTGCFGANFSFGCSVDSDMVTSWIPVLVDVKCRRGSHHAGTACRWQVGLDAHAVLG
jgi:hypothetical protein